MRILLTAMLLMAACNGDGGSNGDDGGQMPDPADKPDILILSVSGHTDTFALLLCDGDNTTYLGDPDDAVEALEQVFTGLGLSHQAYHFADRLEGPGGDPTREGFDELVAMLVFARTNWIDGQADPTRIVLVNHSHGANWTHIATGIVDVPIEYLITLDGICLFWECEHTIDLDGWEAANGPFAFTLSAACSAWNLPGLPDPRDTKDVVFPTVVNHLEVQSSGGLLNDTIDNYREDGTDAGILRLVATEDHSGVHQAAGSSMAWVMQQIVILEGP